MASNKTTAMEPTEESAVVVAGLTRRQVAVVKKTICDGYTDDELQLFLYQCEKLGLDPLAREAYTFKNKGKVVIGTAIDGFRKRADETGFYAPGRATTYKTDGGKLISATVYVRKFLPASGEWVEIEETAYLSEYGAKGGNWITMPRVMLSKCAEARALRRAFPSALRGLYAMEELDAMRRQPQQTRAMRRVGVFRQPPIDTEAEVVEPGTDHYDTAIQIARDAGATDEEIDEAIQIEDLDSKPVGTWTLDDGDRFLNRLDEMRGA